MSVKVRMVGPPMEQRQVEGAPPPPRMPGSLTASMTWAILEGMTRPTVPTPDSWNREHHAGDESHLLREIMRVHQAILGVVSREIGAPASRLLMLRALANAGPSGIGIMALARRLGVDAAAVSRQVSELEADRLVERRRDAADARRSMVRLTLKGVRAFEEVHERAHAFEHSLTSVIDPRDLATAVRVLAEVRRVLEERR